MTRVIDLWRAVDPEARLVSGSTDALQRPVRGVLRTRAAPPHLPPVVDGQLLLVDATILGGGPLDDLLGTLAEAQLRPQAILICGVTAGTGTERAGAELPIFSSLRQSAALADAAQRYADDEAGHLARFAVNLRLAAAEAALVDPTPSAPAGLVAGRIRRGVAVAAEGVLETLHPRPAGRALAARFAAAFARLLAGPGTRDVTRRTRDGLWVMEHAIRDGASVWLFDDLPFARIDETAAEALGITLRALLRRPPPPAAIPEPLSPAPARDGDSLAATLLAVARANGRVAPAAKALGVHRNTVLYRLRRAQSELGVDPRRPEDALKLLRDADPHA